MIENLILGVVSLVLLSLIFQYCWNYGVSPVFNINQVTLSQAFLLLFISKLVLAGNCMCYNISNDVLTTSK